MIFNFLQGRNETKWYYYKIKDFKINPFWEDNSFCLKGNTRIIWIFYEKFQFERLNESTKEIDLDVKEKEHTIENTEVLMIF